VLGIDDPYLLKMKNYWFFLLLAFCPSLSGQEYSRDLGGIRADLRAHDRAVHVFHDWMRDPYIMIGPDGDYYLTCTQLPDSVDGRSVVPHGMALYRSPDLAEWEFLGYRYSLEDSGNFEDYQAGLQERMDRIGQPDHLKLWAPEIYFINDRWVITHTSNVRRGNLAVTRGSRLEPPFDSWGAAFGHNHDPALFQDTDGSLWLISRCTQIQEIEPDLSGFKGEPIAIGPSNRRMGHEGAYIRKLFNRYVLFGTAWSTDQPRKGTYNLYYCISDTLEGPYDERKFAGRYLGHGTPFQDKLGRWWCTAFFNANQPPIPREDAAGFDASEDAYTVNRQGLTLVPLDIKRTESGTILIQPKDPAYASPGPEEVQCFKEAN
jgi:xylan 1,4-beta-xylosidase